MYLQEGQRISIDEFAYSIDSTNVEKLVHLPEDEIDNRKKQSVEMENKLYSEILSLVEKWKSQARNTRECNAAKEYIKTPAMEHTANQWVQTRENWFERSNKVYKMWYRISDVSKFDHTQSKHIPAVHILQWPFGLNYIPYATSPHQIDGQTDKKFESMEALNKYLGGRVKLYDKFFEELSPPIPITYTKHFTRHGVQLPGYTVSDKVKYIENGKEIKNSVPEREIR